MKREFKPEDAGWKRGVVTEDNPCCAGLARGDEVWYRDDDFPDDGYEVLDAKKPGGISWFVKTEHIEPIEKE